MNQILVLGAGLSTSSLISYLLDRAQEHDWFLTVCDMNIDRARERIAGHVRGQAVAFDINDSAMRTALVAKASVVVNMLTRPYQFPVALDCVNNGTHMLSASYQDPRVGALDADAHKRNVLVLNEMGLDPGIDHMVAMSLIHRIHARKGIVRGLHSYGGALPAPGTVTNPLGYAITWNPRNVLMAGEDGAQYKESGRIKILPFHQVFQRTWTVEIDPLGSFEAYPNRDSLAYEAELGLGGESTIIRATLRYPGWCETWQQIVHLGLANEALRIPDLKNMTYRDMTELCLPHAEGRARLEQRVAHYLGISPTGRIMENLRYLGLFSGEKIGDGVETIADAMIRLIQDKLKMPPGARDIVILVHELDVMYPDEGGRGERLVASMIEYGEPNGETAIARTVGMPIAIAVELLLTDRLPITGVRIPTHPAIYEPVLQRLREHGLEWKETVVPRSPSAPETDDDRMEAYSPSR